MSLLEIWEFSQVMFRGGEYDLLFIIRDYLIDGDDLVRGKHQPFFDDNVSDLPATRVDNDPAKSAESFTL